MTTEPEGSQPGRHAALDGPTTALLLQGLQNDLFAPGGRLVDPALSDFATRVGLFEHVKTLADAVRAAGGMVVHALFVVDGDGDGFVANADLYRGIRDSGGVRRGTWGAEVLEDLAPLPEDVVVEKTRENPFHATGLDDLLRRSGIETVIAAGAVTNMGIEFAARYAADIGYEVIVPTDACASHSDDWQRAALDYAVPKVARVLSTSDVVQMLQPATHSQTEGESDD